MRQYHLSYDAIDLDRDFENSDQSRKYILCVLESTDPDDIQSFNESTLIILYKERKDDLFGILKKKLSKYFYYSVSLVSTWTESKESIIDHHKNNILNTNLQKERLDLKCDEFDGY
jgi:hypothetical protein